MIEKESIIEDKQQMMKEEQVPWSLIDVIFTYVFIFALSVFAVGLLLMTGIDANISLFPAVLQVLLSVITISIIFLIVSKKYKIPITNAFGFSAKLFPSHFVQGIAVSFILVISTSLVSYFFTEIIGVTRQNPYINMSAEKMRIISIMAVMLAPSVEEIFFRGYMQPALVKSFGIFGGIFLTALIFGLSHSQYLDYSTALVAVTVIGLILGITRHYTNSVVPGIVAHLFNNFFAAMNLQ